MFIEDIMKAVMLILLAVSANFAGKTLSCDVQQLLTNSMIHKQLLILFLVYFTIQFTEDVEVPSHPTVNMGKALLVWVFYILFSKTHMKSTIAIFILLAVLYTLSSFKNYYKRLENIDDDTVSKEDIIKNQNLVELLQNITAYVIAVAVIISFIIYYLDQKKDHGKNFSIFKFISGVKTCGKLR